jgi:hypothetical protein
MGEDLSLHMNSIQLASSVQIGHSTHIQYIKMYVYVNKSSNNTQQ